MRSLHILSCATAVSAFNLFGDLFQRQQPNCTVYTVVEYPCAVQTFLPSNTVVWVDACSTTLNITNAPTSLKTTITSTTTIGLPKTSTSTVVVSLKTTATIFHTLTLPGPAQPTTTSSTAPVITGTNSGCVPSSTSYPSAPNIPANTTYVISVTSPEIIAHLGNSPVYLTREGGVVDNTNLAVEVFFYDGVLFALDTAFGVGWYGMELSEATMPFALEQYSSSSQSIARTFTTVGSSPPTLAWNNCQFQNENVTWTLNESDGVVSAWFSGPIPLSDTVWVVTLTLLPLQTPTPTPSASSPSVPTGTVAAVSSCTPPSTTGYAPGNDIPANTTYLLQLYWEQTPGSLAPFGGNVYLERDGSYTAANSVVNAIEAFFVDGTLVAQDPIFVYGWYTTTSPAVDAPFALSEYLPEAGLTARTFTMAPTIPPTLVWENCGFQGGAAQFVLNQDGGFVYAVFDGNVNQGANHIPIWIVPTIYT